MFFNLVTVVFIFGFPVNIMSSSQGEEVSKWAEKIGHDLSMLGQAITRYDDIKQKYKHFNARVGEKNPRTLLTEIKGNILRMLDRKMDAIKCIQQTAEDEAEAQAEDFNSTAPYQYYSSKWSSIVGEGPKKIPPSLEENKNMYLPMKLNPDTHFYNIAVNTNHSSVHVPTNIFDKEPPAAFAIQWSEALDNVFTQNYKSDPALSWQYFGSTTGIMRHYPAKMWDVGKEDIFDCRIRTWFIEAATCTKDVVLLVDNSGSMKGMGHHIGSLTASTILDTFSNNDYINVLNYSETTNYTIPCFENQLVQATRENIEIFKEAIDLLEPDGKTRLGQALEVAFDLLRFYREKRSCSENSTNCNQAIMIITDGVNRNESDVILENNYFNNGSNIPVRIFTYLVGKEVANPQELKWISCNNRGYYSHVQTLEQVTASVFQYISVVARPLVLQEVEHPVSWTHAYVDMTYDDKKDDQVNEPYRLLTSVAIPCYDKKKNKMNNTVTAYLLGVAGTDVPLDEFSKLTAPYKIGVNGYAFIVSNNGYVLMHPDLRPVFKGMLKDNYNSIDLTQVEQHNDGLPERDIGETLRKLRGALVDGEEGSMHNIELRYHYDNMKRISEEMFDYYYTPLEETPFTIGIAIPNKYGNYSLEVGDELQKNRHTGDNLTSFFNGKWKIHPKWVYCRYHYLEDHEFNTPEEELVHFLGKMYDMNFKWERHYEVPKTDEDFFVQVDCNKKTLDEDDYYCDKQLVQRLIFDAKNTHELYSENWEFNPKELPLFHRFNASLRFVATMSGLTRWHYIFEEPRYKTNRRREFGDRHPRAINEKWYKSAVLQHQYDDSFVYSVPFDSGDRTDTVVTGSYAIFPSDIGLEAPGSVVGFQFSQARLMERVQDISTKLSNQCTHCSRCSGSLSCYVIDNSGYIIVSFEKRDTGKFFGEVEKDILESMLEENIFRKITVYDYQALCDKGSDGSGSGTTTLLTPIHYIQMMINWIFVKALYLLLELNVYEILEPMIVYAQESIKDASDHINKEKTWQNTTVLIDFLTESNQNVGQNISDGNNNTHVESEQNITRIDEREEEYDKNDFYACEKVIDLYVLQQKLFIEENFQGEISRPNARNYYVKRIPSSNLIFVAINSTGKPEDNDTLTTEPRRITDEPKFEHIKINTTLLPCKKLNLTNLPRRRLSGCFNEDPQERLINDCGKATCIKINLILILLNLLIWICL